MKAYIPHLSPVTRQVTLGIGTAPGDVQVSECIYCSSREELTDEHPIPYGLWGKWKLINGSCSKCSRITSNFELEVLRGSLGRPREILSSPTRHSKKRKLRTGQTIAKGEDGQILSVPNWALAQFALLPVFNYLPRSLQDEPKLDHHTKFDIRICPITETQDPRLSGFWGDGFKIDPNIWARFLVKVAYGEFIRTIDQEYRSKAISDFILRGEGDQSWILGGRSIAPRLECIYMITFSVTKIISGKIHLLAYVRLLPFLETPSYLINLGEIHTLHSPYKNLPIRHIDEIGKIWPNYPN